VARVEQDEGVARAEQDEGVARAEQDEIIYSSSCCSKPRGLEQHEGE